MTVTALNYAASAVADLKKTMHLYPETDRKIITGLIDQIERSVHFSVPDNGDIFDDGFRGLRGAEVRLPFPEVTVEYHVTREETHPDLIQAPKRLIVASMMRTDDLREKLKAQPLQAKVPADATSEWVIVVSGLCDFCQGRGWFPMPGSYCIMSLGWDDYSKGQPVDTFHEHTGRNPGISGFPIILLPSGALHYFKNLGGDIELFWKHLCNDIGAEAAVVMEMCEALSCTNVGITTVQKVAPGVNERRLRDGKLSLHEIRALEIITPGQSRDVMYGPGGDRASPRQHLRRGHIRRLENGKNVWIPSCVVGRHGRIDKTYSIKGMN